MKNLLSLILFFGISHSLLAQAQSNWQVTFDTPIEWSNISSTGNLIVCTKDALYGLDPEKKGQAWRISELAEIELSQMEEIENTPFAIVSDISGPRKSAIGGLVKLPQSSSSRFWLLNTYTGEKLFDSQTLGFSSILGKELVLESGAFFVMGMENKERVLAMIGIQGEGLRWKQKVPVQTKTITIKDIAFYPPTLDPGGNLIYYYGNKLFRIDIENGKILWEQPYPEIQDISFGPGSNNTFYAIAGLKKELNAFSLDTGEPLWFDVLPGTLGNYFKSRAKKAEATIPAVGQVDPLSKSEPNNTLLSSVGYRVEGEEEDPFFLVSEKGFNFFSYDSGKPSWENPHTFTSYEVNRVIPTQDGYVARLLASESWFLTYCDDRGTPIWKKPVRVRGSIMDLYVMTEHGLVYLTNEELGILDKRTGAQKLNKPFKLADDNEFIPYFDWEKGWAIIYQNKSLYKVDFASASIQEITDKVRLKGDGKDFPSVLEEVENGYFLANEQNLVKVDYQGNIIYQQYHQRPGAPMWLKRTAVGALNVVTAVAIIAASQYAQMEAIGSYYQGNTSYSYAMNTVNTYDLENPDNPFYTLGADAQNAYKKIAARNQAAYSGSSEMFVLAKLDDDSVGLKRIEKNSGEETGSLVLGDKNPSYAVDEFLGVLYYFTKNNKGVEAFELG